MELTDDLKTTQPTKINDLSRPSSKLPHDKKKLHTVMSSKEAQQTSNMFFLDREGNHELNPAAQKR